MNQRNDFTQRLLSSYLKVDMRVLDIGCGTGDVSFLASNLVGKNGQVSGVDMDDSSLKRATEQAKQHSIINVRFLKKDINALDFEPASFDAIIGRRILMYQTDPLTVIKQAKKLLKPNGIMLFQESDAMALQLSQPDFTLHQHWQSIIWQTVKQEGGNLSMGSQLAYLMSQANLEIVDYISENVIQTPVTGSDIAWVISMMLPRMQKFGLIEKNIDIDKLTDDLQTEMQWSKHAFIRDVNFGVCAKKAN